MTQPSGYDAAPWISGQMCPMLAVDIAEFTRADRDDEVQLQLRISFHGILREALGGSGMPWDQCQHEDRGDGVVVIVPPRLPAQPMIDSLPERLRCLIRRHNRFSCQSVRMQPQREGQEEPLHARCERELHAEPGRERRHPEQPHPQQRRRTGGHPAVNGFTIDETGVDDSADSSQGALLRGSEGEDAYEIVPGVNCPGWLGACGLARDLVERLPR